MISSRVWNRRSVASPTATWIGLYAIYVYVYSSSAIPSSCERPNGTILSPQVITLANFPTVSRKLCPGILGNELYVRCDLGGCFWENATKVPLVLANRRLQLPDACAYHPSRYYLKFGRTALYTDRSGQQLSQRTVDYRSEKFFEKL